MYDVCIGCGLMKSVMAEKPPKSKVTISMRTDLHQQAKEFAFLEDTDVSGLIARALKREMKAAGFVPATKQPTQ